MMPIPNTNWNAAERALGVFTVLSAFDLMSVESAFAEDGDLKHRSFNFSLNEELVEIDAPITSLTSSGSHVTLHNLRSPFFQKSAISTDSLCEEIVNHTLLFYLTGHMPDTFVIDGGVTYDLRVYFRRFLGDKSQTTVQVGEEKFQLYFISAARMLRAGIKFISVPTIVPFDLRP